MLRFPDLSAIARRATADRPDALPLNLIWNLETTSNRTEQLIRVVRQAAGRFSSDIELIRIRLRDRPTRGAIAKNNPLLYTRNSIFCKVAQSPGC